MNKIDYHLYNIPMLLAANKSREYRNQIINSSEVLLSFLYKNKLLVDVEPFNHDGTVKLDLILKISNVTEEGLELFKKVIPSWMQFLDKGGKLENISKLENGLKSLREIK